VFFETCIKRELEAESFSACPRLALCAGMGGYVLKGVLIRGLSCVFFYFGGSFDDGWVYAYIYVHTHTTCDT